MSDSEPAAQTSGTCKKKVGVKGFQEKSNKEKPSNSREPRVWRHERCCTNQTANPSARPVSTRQRPSRVRQRTFLLQCVSRKFAQLTGPARERRITDSGRHSAVNAMSFSSHSGEAEIFHSSKTAPCDSKSWNAIDRNCHTKPSPAKTTPRKKSNNPHQACKAVVAKLHDTSPPELSATQNSQSHKKNG